LRGPGAAEADPFVGGDGEGTLSQDLFFVTLTTTGYGNLVPAANPGQSLAALEALVGQLFVATAVGKVVSACGLRGWQRTAHEPEETAEEPRAQVP
jgi:hypothetical protein